MSAARSDQAYLPRYLKGALEAALSDTPVVCLLGPRQCGKSTLARLCEPNRHYVSLDDKGYFAFAQQDPEGFINGLPEQAAIDEVQRVPELTLAIKRNVDANRKAGRFLLTGSADLMQLPRMADSLAGRMECLHLHPLTEAEVRRSPGRFLERLLAADLKPEIKPSGKLRTSELPAVLLAGGFPESVKRDFVRGDRWRRNYSDPLSRGTCAISPKSKTRAICYACLASWKGEPDSCSI